MIPDHHTNRPGVGAGFHRQRRWNRRTPGPAPSTLPAIAFAFSHGGSPLGHFHSLPGRPRRGGALMWTLTALFALSVTLASASTAFYEIARLGRRNRQRVVALQVGQQK